MFAAIDLRIRTPSLGHVPAATLQHVGHVIPALKMPKQGAKFVAPTFAANADTMFEFVKVSDTTFHIPDVYGIGVSVSPIPVLKINADAVHITYSNLVDNFISINEDIRAIDKAYKAADVTEVHLGAEYFFFLNKLPVAVRAGVWKDPAHAIEYRGPLLAPDAVAAAILYPKSNDQHHVSVGFGLAWPKFQVDAAYDRSPRYRTNRTRGGARGAAAGPFAASVGCTDRTAAISAP